MKSIKFKALGISWYLQLYYPAVELRHYFHIRMATAITISKTCVGFELLGFGAGLGWNK